MQAPNDIIKDVGLIFLFVFSLGSALILTPFMVARWWAQCSITSRHNNVQKKKRRPSVPVSPFNKEAFPRRPYDTLSCP